MNKYGETFIMNSKDVLKNINAKIKLSEVINEKKFVNETGDKITFLQISDEPKNDLDSVNLKYVKNLENKLKLEITKIKQENQNFKNGVEVLAKQIKRQIEKIKGDVARHAVNELKIQKENVESHMKQIKTEIKQEIKQENAKQTEWIEKIKTEIKTQITELDISYKNKIET